MDDGKEIKIGNIEELRKEEIEVFKLLRKGHIEHHRAKELTNCVGKVINTVKVQLEYAKLRKEKPVIPFVGMK